MSLKPLFPSYLDLGVRPALYDDQSMTVIESEAEVRAKVSESINAFNSLKDYTNSSLNYLLGTGLQIEVNKQLNQMLINGMFENIIDEVLLNGVNGKLNNMAKRLESTTVDEINLELEKNATDGYSTIFPVNGLIEIDKPIIIPKNSKIFGNNCTIKRKGGTVPFDMIVNKSYLEKPINIDIFDLIIDGNKDVDNLIPTNPVHRFSGIHFESCSNFTFKNIKVTKTVNAEHLSGDGHPAGGIFIVDCEKFYCEKIVGYNNDRTAVLFFNCNDYELRDSYLYDNLGSGFSSDKAHNGRFHNILCDNNGYSNFSVNGNNCVVDLIISRKSSYSAINFGHSNSPSHNLVATNLIGIDSLYEGLTIGGSSDVSVSNAYFFGNSRNNVRIFADSTKCKLSNIVGIGSLNGSGLLIDTGIDHNIINCTFNRNALNGAYLSKNTSGIITNIICKDNGVKTSANSSGIVLNETKRWVIDNPVCTCENVSATQESGIWLNKTLESILIKTPYVDGNKTYKIRRTTNPIFSVILEPTQKFTINAETGGWSGNIEYSRDSSGNCILQGLISGGSGDVSSCTLPIGYRPSINLNLPVTLSDNTIGYVQITTGGQVKPHTSTLGHNINVMFKVSETQYL